MKPPTATNGSHKIKLKRFLAVAAFLALYMLIAKIITGTSCFFQSTIGLPCPGCGLTRAFMSFFSLHIREAFGWHPLFFYIPVLLGVCLFKRLKYGAKELRWYSWFLWGSCALFIGIFAVRMALFFPHTEPFVLNRFSFTQRALSLIIHLLRL